MAWYLSFHHPGPKKAPSLDSLVSALQEGFGSPIPIKHGDWGGNPRDGYQRRVRTSFSFRANDSQEKRKQGAVQVSAELAIESGFSPEQADACDTSLVEPAIGIGDAHLMEAAWHTFQKSLLPLGYKDTTLSGPMLPLLEEWQAIGEYEHVQKLQAQITDAICKRIAELPEYWSLIIRQTRPDNLKKIFDSTPSPEQKDSMVLSGLGLSELPLKDIGKERFVKVWNLDLSENELQSLPKEEELLEYLPALKQINLRKNPLSDFSSANWPHLKIIL